MKEAAASSRESATPLRRTGREALGGVGREGREVPGHNWAPGGWASLGKPLLQEGSAASVSSYFSIKDT